MSKKWISFCVFILGLVIHPSICFSEAGLHSEKINTLVSLKAESDLGINMTGSNNLGINKDYTSMTQGQYIAGGILGALPGLGIGHVIQGRWFEKGWIFTGTQLGLYYLTLISFAYANTTTGYIDSFLIFVPFYLFAALGLKVWEAVDVWSLPSHYKIVQEPKLSISPLYSHNSQSSSYGLSLSYKW